MKNNVPTLKPAYRKLRAYAFDPSLSLTLDTYMINNTTYKVFWEDVDPGPIGEYIEVVDYDPSSRSFYKPVDLNTLYIVAQDGLNPSESNPQFHQQMVYAVAMTTIKNFEQALGRKIMWSLYMYYNENDKLHSRYVQRLRLYPHALREPNAYYSPQKKAILFGYFAAAPSASNLHLPGGTVYTCLSHDIIAHEVTHALLDGMHRRYVEATNPDSLAFHEAFADIVALFQHFTFPDVLKEQISKTRGDLASQNLLGELAQQFGKAIGQYSSLRDALGEINPATNKWEPIKPDPSAYLKETEPHQRGAILVATIFDAFINIYKSRVADLLRIASNGSGIVTGALHPDLVERMAKEASKSAGHILRICIRALDYCPPMDISFGDYLKAIITADYDLIADDERDYRIAIIEAFQKRGIFPEGVKNMSVESLLCKADHVVELDVKFETLINFFKDFKGKISYVTNRESIYLITEIFKGGSRTIKNLDDKYKESINNLKLNDIMGLHERLNVKFMGEDLQSFSNVTGLILDPNNIENLGIGHSMEDSTLGMPLLEVHNLKLASRTGPKGNVVNQILVILTQRRGVVCGKDENGDIIVKGFFIPRRHKGGWYERKYGPNDTVNYVHRKFPFHLADGNAPDCMPDGWFIFRGGCSLIFDLDYESSGDNVTLKYVIKKKIDDEERMKRQYNLMFNDNDFSLNATYFGSAYSNLEAEPFAMIHKNL